MNHALLFIAACAISVCASGATVYKCKNAQGQIELSDMACPAGTSGTQVELKPNTLDSSDERERNMRNDLPRWQQAGMAPGRERVDRSQSYECRMAQKNAWGADRAAAQRKADLICLGSEGAATVQQERLRTRPVLTTCTTNSFGQSICITR